MTARDVTAYRGRTNATPAESHVKTITMSELRREPGEIIREVQRGGQSFLVTKAGKPAAKLVPVDDTDRHPARQQRARSMPTTQAPRR